jgi:hypothetical protein
MMDGPKTQTKDKDKKEKGKGIEGIQCGIRDYTP